MLSMIPRLLLASILLLLPCGSLGLRLEQGKSKKSDARASQEVSLHHGLDHGAGHLPPHYFYNLQWQYFKYTHMARLAGKVQLILGVFSMEWFPYKEQYHNIIKNTWMNHSQVCWLSHGKKSGCSVYVAFVLGTKHNSKPTEEELVLGTGENLNNGKTYEYFHHVAEKYGWATHIGKIDLDAYPFLPTLTISLEAQMIYKPNCEGYVGRRWTCTVDDTKKHAYCPPHYCGPPLNNNFRNYSALVPNCWSYMQGGMYIMTTNLAKGVAAAGGRWSKNKVGIEDALTGSMVAKYAREQDICVRTWDPKAYYHFGGGGLLAHRIPS